VARPGNKSQPTATADTSGDKIRVARIGAAHGVRGEMKLWSFTQDPAAVADYGPLETAAGKRFEIASMRAAKDHFVVRIEGVTDRDEAAKLCNLDLYVPRDRLPPIDEDDTYYQADLIGLAAVTPEGQALGTVTAMHNFGAGDLIEIATTQGGEPLLLPFTQAIVPEVDIPGRKVVVVLPTVSE
jgi:16S rRNA processing protein RimM